MNSIAVCPTSDRLKLFITGQLPEAEVETLAAHLEVCSNCVQSLHTLHDAAVTSDLRAGATLSDSGQQAPLVQELMGRLIASRDKLGTASSVASSDAPTIAPAGPAGSGELAFLSAPQASDEIGRLNGYRVLKILGAGGMGLVLEAEDLRLKRRVALKVMKAEIATKGQNRQRFLREAEAAARVEHDHIVPIFQVGEENGVPFIAMPFLKGEPLDARLKHGPVEMPQIIRIGLEIAEGLAAAHEHGLMHRDIKPGNIWLEEVWTTKRGAGNEKQRISRVRILDFGLARLSGDSENLTQSGMILGTPSYMAPEQARGRNVDFRVDLWSLGCILYEMCTGQRPFNGPDTVAIIASLALDQPASPRSLNPNIPAELEQLIMKLLEKDPAGRPASAADVAEALRKLQPEAAVVVLAEPLATEVSPWASLESSVVSSASASATPVAETRGAESKGKSRSFAKWHVAAALLLLVGVGFAAYQLAFKTKDGTLIVEVEGTDADVRFADGELHIYDPGTKALLYKLKPSEKNKSLPPGKYLISVAGPGGLKLDTDNFEITRNGTRTVTVRADDGKVALSKEPKSEPTPAAGTELLKSGWPALKFDGVRSYVAIPSLERDAPSPITLEAWINRQNDDEFTGLLMRLMGKAPCHFSLARPECQLAGRDSSPKGPFLRVVFSEHIVKINTWTHVCYVIDRQEVRLFVDGRLSSILAGPMVQQPVAPDKERGAGIGGMDNITWRFKGLMAGLRVSKSARYLKDFTPPLRFEKDGDTLALYHFDEGSGDKLTDSSGNNHHGKIIAATWVKADGSAIEKSKPTSPAVGTELLKSGRPALAFDGARSYVAIPNLERDAPAPITLEAWISRQNDNIDSSALLMRLTGKAPCHFSLVRPEFRLDGRDPSPKGPRARVIIGAHIVEMNSWTHVCYVIDQQEIRLFVDGRLSGVITGPMFQQPVAPETERGAGIGGMAGITWRFKGLMAGLRVSKSARYLKDFTAPLRFEKDGDTLALYHFDEGSGDKLTDSSGNNYHGKIIEATWVKADGSPIERSESKLPIPNEIAAKKLQEDWAAKLKLPVEATNKIGMKMILIPPADDALSKAYYLGKFEVTQGEWEKVMGYNPSLFGPKNPKVAGLDTSKFPVEKLSWFDNVEFCNKLSEREGLKPYYELTVKARSGPSIADAGVKILGGNGYHIPTVPEWEHGCRAGTKTKFHCGDKDQDLLEYAWIKDNSGERTHPVGEKKPNAFGLYDMHGNVCEWNEDMSTNERGDSGRVYRGGDWSRIAKFCIVSSLELMGPAHHHHGFGLRVARAASSDARSEVAPAASVDPDRRAAEWVLSIGGKVVLEGKKGEIAKKDDLPPGAFAVVEVLLAGNPRVTAEGLKNLAGLKKLEHLVLQKCGPEVNKAIATIASLTSLKDVDFIDCGITDQGLKELRNLTKLTGIGLCDNPLTDACLADLEQFENLTGMAIRHTKISWAKLARLKRVKNLDHLWLAYSEITDTDLEHFKEMPKLTSLQLYNTAISDKGLETIRGMTSLQALRLNDTKVTEAGVKKLSAALPKCRIDWDGGAIVPK